LLKTAKKFCSPNKYPAVCSTVLEVLETIKIFFANSANYGMIGRVII